FLVSQSDEPATPDDIFANDRFLPTCFGGNRSVRRIRRFQHTGHGPFGRVGKGGENQAFDDKNQSECGPTCHSRVCYRLGARAAGGAAFSRGLPEGSTK